MSYKQNDDRALEPYEEGQLTRRAVDWGIGGTILAIVVMTALYIFSPLDLVPDLIPVAGQADDVAAIFAGGGSVVFLTLLRYVSQAIMRSRTARIGCLIVVVLAAIGALTVFWALLKLFDSIF